MPSTPKPLTKLPVTPGAQRAYDVAADDQRFLTATGQAVNDRAEINVVQHWFEEVKKRIP